MTSKSISSSNRSQRPLCSIVIPAYNGAAYIRDALDSVKAQGFCDFECIVIDDCSTDNTFDIANEYAKIDERFIVLKNETSLFAAGSRNRGVESARGEYIAFLDCDDIFLPEKLETQLTLMRENDSVFSCTAYKLVDRELNSLGKIQHVSPVITFDELIKENTIGCSTVMAKRELIKAHPFTNDFMHEDYVCWLDCVRDCGELLGIDIPLTDYRFMDGTKSSNKLKSAMATYSIYRKHLGLGIGKSSVLMYNYILRKLRKYKNMIR